MAVKTQPGLLYQDKSRPVQVFISRVRLTVIVLLVAGLIFSYFFVYLPLHKALQRSLLTNFSHTASLNYSSIQSSLERGQEGARSLSSRTMIKEAIVQYLAGEMSLDQLQEYTQSRYEDGAKALDYLLLSKRYVNDELIASYKSSNVEVKSCLTMEYSGVLEMETDLCLMGEQAYYVVVSPIIHDQLVLGYDNLIFDLTDQTSQPNSSYTTRLMPALEFNSYFSSAHQVQTDGQATIYKLASEYYYAVELPNDVFYITWQDGDILFAQIRRISLMIFLILLVMLTGFALFANYFVVSYARKELLALEIDSKALRTVTKEVQIDHLTGAASRRYGIHQLEAAFINYQRTGEAPLIMLLDVDSFKKINDSHGHAAGDLVLETIVAAIKQNIRADDLLIRWGGDEFVAIFAGLKKEDSISFGKKIQAAVRSRDVSTENGLILPTVSIGLSYFINEDSSYNEAIQRADLAMYRSKAKGGNNVNACWLAQLT